MKHSMRNVQLFVGGDRRLDLGETIRLCGHPIFLLETSLDRMAEPITEFDASTAHIVLQLFAIDGADALRIGGFGRVESEPTIRPMFFGFGVRKQIGSLFTVVSVNGIC